MSNEPFSCLVEKIRSTDTNRGIIAGDFITKNKRDFVIGKNDTLEFYYFDPSNYTFQPSASYCLFAHIYCLSPFNVKDQNANVFDDLQEDLDFRTLKLELDQLKSRLQDPSIPLLERYSWQGSDLVLVTSSRGFLDIFAIAIHPLREEPVFLHLKEILIKKKQFFDDYRELGSFLAVHSQSHDIALAAYQDKVEVWSSPSPAVFYTNGNTIDPPQCQKHTPTLILWHLFYLQPHPFLNTNYLVAVGYRDVAKQAVITLFEKTESETFTHSLPFDLFTYPSILLAFPLPFNFDTFCIATELYLIICKVPDIMNGNTSLKRIALPDAGAKLCGYCTIPNCVTEYFYLLSEKGVLYKTSLKQIPTMIKQLNILDGNLIYIKEEQIDSKSFDVLLVYSDRCDWTIVRVGAHFFEQVIVYESISPVSCAVSLGDQSVLLAGNDQLVHLQEKRPFYVQSKSNDEFEGVEEIFGHENWILLSFVFQSRLLQLLDGELMDVTQETEIISDAHTLYFCKLGSRYYQCTPSRIVACDAQLRESFSWSVPESMAMTHALVAPQGVYAVLALPGSRGFQVTRLSLDLAVMQRADPVAMAPTCLACSPTQLYVGTYGASVLVYTADLTSPAVMSLPDQHIPNALLVLPEDGALWVGCRNGVCHRGDTTTSVGAGPVRLFHVGTEHFLLCDDQLFLDRDIGPAAIDIQCRGIAPFFDGLMCLQKGCLVYGKLGTGMCIKKFGLFSKPPRRLLVTDTSVLAICTARQSSDIVIMDRAFEVKSKMHLTDMVVSCSEWRAPFKRPKILMGTAVFNNDKQIGGQLQVYQFKVEGLFNPEDSIYDLDPEPWKSSMFQGPVRAMTPFGKLGLLIATADEIRHEVFDPISQTIANQAKITFESTVTCVAVHETTRAIAVGTVRDSVTVVRATDQRLEAVACDGYARHVADMVWQQDLLVACDLHGTVFGLAYHAPAHLTHVFMFHLGLPLVRCLPLGVDLLCVSVAGALLLLRANPDPTLLRLAAHPRHSAHASYRLYRQIPALPPIPFQLVDLEKLAQDPWAGGETVAKWSRKL